MITPAEALGHVFDLVDPLPEEQIDLRDGLGRVLLRSVSSTRQQPPFAASAMDGYAAKSGDIVPGGKLRVIGEAAAGHGSKARLGVGEAARIFTGAPVPAGADHVIIQEDVTQNGEWITINDAPGSGPNIRPAGADFLAGDRFAAPARLRPPDLALLASMNIPRLSVARKPVVALMATGDELVMPGEEPGPDQIIASNSFGLAAMVSAAGGIARILPIARDTRASLRSAFELAGSADLIVTIGGASVGDHDLVGPVARELGMVQSFYKVAMRPGKPLMAGKLGKSILLGLPGNPVSSMVCAQLFMLPLLAAMQGLPAISAPRLSARLTHDLAENGVREHYMRALVDGESITAFDRQDSALLSVLSKANALIVRAPMAAPAKAGVRVQYLPLSAPH